MEKATAMEKRGSTRNSAEIEIVCQPYSSTSAGRHCSAVLRNFSDGGVYIEAPYEYSPGTILLIRTANAANPSNGLYPKEGLRTICLAEVRWRQNLRDTQTIRHGMGLGYLK